MHYPATSETQTKVARLSVLQSKIQIPGGSNQFLKVHLKGQIFEQ